MRVVIDTNIIVSGLRSKNGLSYQILKGIASLPIDICLSVALLLEYESVLKRSNLVRFSNKQIDIFLDFFAANSLHSQINYLWRPYLTDPKDDLLLELAFNANASIITYNLSDFKGSEDLGVKAIEPATLFRTLIKKGWKA